MKKSNQERFFNLIKEMFIGEKIEGDGAYVNLMKLKSLHFTKIKDDIEQKLYIKKNKEEIYDKLYTFFHTYFDKSGGIMFANTPRWKNIYSKLSGKDVELFYKTKDLYYLKTQKVYNSMKLELDSHIFDFRVNELGNRIGNEKKDIEFYFVDYKKTETARFMIFKVKYKEKQDYEPLKQILNIDKPDKIRKYLFETKEKNQNIKIVKNFVYENLDKLSASDIELLITNEDTNTLYPKVKIEFVLTKYKAIKKILKDRLWNELKEDIFNKAIKTYKKQSEIDYFIHKNSEKFLKEQFNLYMFNYLNDETIFDEERLKELKELKEIAFDFIEQIAEFEDELVRIWNKPRFALNSNYVITKDRLEKYGVLEKFITHKNINSQIEEWKELKIIDENFDIKDIGKYQFLPFDTKYFKDIEIDLLEKIDNLDDKLDGRLIRSENYQALNTILPKYKNRIDLIYIDPPFNTGSDFDYIDKYQDSTWLTLMDNRLELSHKLLSKKGSFYLHLDYRANHLGRFLLDDIFGKNNFRNEIIWSYRSGGASKKESLPRKHDTIYLYAKTDLFEVNSKYERQYYENDFMGCKKDKNGNYYVDTLLRDVFEGKILINENNSLFEYNIQPVLNLSKEHLGFGTQKPEMLLKLLFDISLNKNSYILDFFAGSGSSIVTAHKLKHKWLGIETGEHFNNIIIPRMKEVLSGNSKREPCGISVAINWQGGGFFKYYSLEQYEDIIKKAEYKNSIETSPLLGIKGIKLKNKIYYDFENIYLNIDLAETISNLLGKKIVKITKEKIILEDREIDLKNLTFENYPELKSLIYWGDENA